MTSTARRQNPRRPEQVRVGPYTYRVLADAAAIRRHSVAQFGSDTTQEWSAFSDHEKLVIGINPRTHPVVQRQDLLHEVLHCALRTAGVWPNAYSRTRAKVPEEDLDGYTSEEFVVASLGHLLLGVLRDNPSLLRWLTAKDPR